MESSKWKQAVITSQTAYDSAMTKLRSLLVNAPKSRDVKATVTMQMLHKFQVRQAEKNVADTLSKLQIARRNFKNAQLFDSMFTQSEDMRKGNNFAPKSGEFPYWNISLHFSTSSLCNNF
jgi:hypothetical protein